MSWSDVSEQVAKGRALGEVPEQGGRFSSPAFVLTSQASLPGEDPVECPADLIKMPGKMGTDRPGIDEARGASTHFALVAVYVRVLLGVLCAVS